MSILQRAYERILAASLVVLAPVAMLFLVIHVTWGLLVGVILFPALPAGARNALVQFWARIALVLLGIRLELTIEPNAAQPKDTLGSLLLINHTSWSDVFVVAAVAPARFVAKSELASWPVLGRFAACVGTIFVQRGRRHAVAQVNASVAQRLHEGQSIGVFPEGTTTDGTYLLRFHANLVQAALEANAPVIPLALQYRQGDAPSTAPAYVGDISIFESLWSILKAPRLEARLHWLPAIATESRSRHAIADAARSAIATTLRLSDHVAQEASNGDTVSVNEDLSVL